MSLPIQKQTNETEGSNSGWKGLFIAGGAAALVIVLTGLLDVFLSFGKEAITPGTRTPLDWFNMIQDNWFLGLRELGLFNIITSTCMVVVICALFAAHRRTNPAFAGLAAAILCIGTAVYASTNTALPMLTLSNQYAAATDEAQKSLLITAGKVMLAQEDITAGTFLGFFILEIAGLMMSIVMLKGKVFNRLTAWMGILAESCMIVFNILGAFAPAAYSTAFIFGMSGGVFSTIWLILTALKLFRLGEGTTH